MAWLPMSSTATATVLLLVSLSSLELGSCLIRPAPSSSDIKQAADGFSNTAKTLLASAMAARRQGGGKRAAELETRQAKDNDTSHDFCDLKTSEDCQEASNEYHEQWPLNSSYAGICSECYTSLHEFYSCLVGEEAVEQLALTCSRNAKGEVCGDFMMNAELQSNFTNHTNAAYTECVILPSYDYSINATDSTTCSDECGKVLSIIRDTYGCCYNSTLSSLSIFPELINSTLWASCGLKDTGVCDTPNITNVEHHSTPTTTLVTTTLVTTTLVTSTPTTPTSGGGVDARVSRMAAVGMLVWFVMAFLLPVV